MELRRIEPILVESKLAADRQVLEVILDQVHGIQQEMDHLKCEIKKTQKLKYDLKWIKSQTEIRKKILLSLMEQQKMAMITM